MKEYNKKDIKAGMKLRCTDNGGWEHWTTGKVYNVFKNMMGRLVIQSDTGGQREVTDIVQYLKGVAKAKFELLNEEEKEVTKYAKITKYEGLYADRMNGLEIGKEYKIISYDNPYNDDCRIYLNENHPKYYISEEQYELVEKPTFKTTIDLKSSVQAKIDELNNEAEHLFKKRDRLEQQAIDLNKKARKLNKLIETINEFE
ncbi:hypothetical protein TV51_55 [Enterococcus phage vB_EFaS_TV51]|uniref:Tail length tape-measure protein n=1 Tax=Enterococcus phage vB_EFaS_TV51 TaxID=2759207 RepID=A0A7S6GHM8_9CAUD|nr:hypothetical protein TV51_55 [Enterococcus phage vB_EFaS_TV51]